MKTGSLEALKDWNNKKKFARAYNSAAGILKNRSNDKPVNSQIAVNTNHQLN
jgi:hypothetical protein